MAAKMDRQKMTASEVPWALCCDIPSRETMKVTRMAPPPRPVNPPKNPSKAPMRTVFLRDKKRSPSCGDHSTGRWGDQPRKQTDLEGAVLAGPPSVAHGASCATVW